MSEVIVRMEMPLNCAVCRCHTDGWCYMLSIQPSECAYDSRPSWCPIIGELPEQHGRLVDADACSSVLRKLENEAKTSTEKLCYGYAARMFEEAFTIIAAERKDDE